MGNSNLTIGKFLIHIIDGTEDTEKILQLCEELKTGKYIKIDSKDYCFYEIPEFLAKINKKCKIDLEVIYNHYYADIQEIWRRGVEVTIGEIENIINEKESNSK